LKSSQDADLSEIRRWIHVQVGGHGDAQLNYNRLSPDAITLEGLVNGHRVRVTLERDERQFILKTRGFHWIIEDQDMFY
jgi:hypothetical protein